MIDFGGGRVLRVNPFSGAATTFATVTGASGLNALAFDRAGNVYISDSAQGIVWRTGPGGGAAVAWVSHPLLATTAASRRSAPTAWTSTAARARCSSPTPATTA